MVSLFRDVALGLDLGLDLSPCTWAQLDCIKYYGVTRVYCVANLGDTVPSLHVVV